MNLQMKPQSVGILEIEEFEDQESCLELYQERCSAFIEPLTLKEESESPITLESSQYKVSFDSKTFMISEIEYKSQ